MKLKPVLALVVAFAAASASAAVDAPSWRDPAQSRQGAMDMAAQTLARLFEVEPRARKEFGEAVAYAVFDVDAGGDGTGVAVETSIRETTLMGVQGERAATPGGYRQVWLFDTTKAYLLFVAHGHAFAEGTRLEPSTVRGKPWPPGAFLVANDVIVYHLGKDGLVTDVTMPESHYRRNAAFDRSGRF